MEENGYGGFFWGLFVAAIIYFLFFRGAGKYQGQNAEYWFGRYDATSAAYDDAVASYDDLYSCVEEYYDDPDDIYYNCL